MDWLLIALAGCLALTIFQAWEWVRTDGLPGVPLDDAWIHYRFADNLIHGYGFSYNPGEPTPGSTSPLWTLLLAGARLVTGEFLITSKALSALGLIGSGWALYEYVWRRTGRRRLALAAGVLTVWAGRLLWAGMSGMETTLFTLLSILAVDLHERDLGVGRMRPLTAVIFGLASQARPEGHLLFGLYLVDNLWSVLRTGREQGGSVHHRVKRMIANSAIYLLINMPYALFTYTTTHHFLPNTFLAKATPGFAYSLRLVAEYWRDMLWQDNPVIGVLLPLGWVVSAGAALRVRRGDASRASSLLMPAWVLVFPLLMGFVIKRLWHNGRYLMPVVPFNLLLALVGLDWLVNRVGSKWASKIIPRLLWTLGLILTLTVSGYQVVRWADRFALNVDNINDIQVRLGDWAAENTPADALLALDDIGAITFLSNHRILDMAGLVSPEVWPVNHLPEGRIRNLAMLRFLSVKNVDYVLMWPGWHWELYFARDIFVPVHRVAVERNTILGGDEMIVYQPCWPYVIDPVVTHPLEADLGGLMRLTGFDLLPAGEVAPGGEVRLTLYWESLAATDIDYKVFVHLADDAEQIWGQRDAHPVDALAPTSFWQPGDVVRDEHVFAVAPDAPSGEYRLMAGMYDQATMTRLPVESDLDAGSGRILLTRIRVSQ